MSNLILFDARAFLLQWMTLNPTITVDTQGGITDEANRTRPSILATLYLDYIGQLREVNAGLAKNQRISSLPKDHFKDALLEYTEALRYKMRQEAVAKLTCTGENLDPLRQFLTLLTGNCEEKIVAVMAHWLWNVKQKMYGKVANARWEMLPVWIGKQGSGKSEVATLLCSPLTGYFLEAKISRLQDERFDHSLAKNFIVRFDELQDANRTDIETLKSKVTAKVVNPRVFYTTDVISMPQNCMFIGTSNKQIAESFVDGTGMRRFYEFKTLDQLDEAATKAFDYTALWRGIDENKANGYIDPYLTEIRQDQEEYRYIDDVEGFLNFYKISALSTGPKLPMYLSDLYGQYKAFVSDRGYAKPRVDFWFARKLRAHGLRTEQLTAYSDRTVTRRTAYFVNVDCELPPAMFPHVLLNKDDKETIFQQAERYRASIQQTLSDAELEKRKEQANIKAVVRGDK